MGRPVPRLALVGAVLATAAYVAAAWLMFEERERWLGSESYARIAASLLGGSGYTIDGVHPTAQRPPGYPLILMAIMSMAGKHWFAAAIFLQALAAVACLWLIFRIADRLWPGTPAPWLGIGLLLLHGPFMIEMISLRETAWYTLSLLAVACLLLRSRPGPAGAVMMGVWLAILYLLRPTGLMMAIVTFPFFGWAVHAEGSRLWRSLVIAGVAGLLLILPWQTYTWRVFGAPGFFPSSLVGFNLSKSTLPEMAAVYPWIDADTLDQRVRNLAAPVPLEDERAAGARYQEIAHEALARTPLVDLGRRMLVNAAAFVSPLPIPLGRGEVVESGRGVALGKFQPDWLAIAFSPLICLILVAGSLGIGSLCRSGGMQRRFGWWTTALLVVLFAVHALTFVKTRYRLPLDALLAVAAGGWLARFHRGTSRDTGVTAEPAASA